MFALHRHICRAGGRLAAAVQEEDGPASFWKKFNFSILVKKMI